VLGHILSNAVKFTPSKGSVSVRLRNDENNPVTGVIASVTDTGTGITPDNLQQLFTVRITLVWCSNLTTFTHTHDTHTTHTTHTTTILQPFSQLDSSIGRKYGGSGLGLALSGRLCRAMGGSIECESQLGHGSTFTYAHPPLLRSVQCGRHFMKSYVDVCFPPGAGLLCRLCRRKTAGAQAPP
jgi:signal transduction histidine kinase